MRLARFAVPLAVLVSLPVSLGLAGDGNRFARLDEVNPWHPHAGSPKLVTPQWIGEEGVEAVVILAIDDMRQTAKYEEYLRPILIRLKQIDGRAPVSIMTCKADPKDLQLQKWLDEGLSIDVHTVDHPCPLLQGGDFAKAKSTYDRCVDVLAAIPRNAPVAFRTPCCDSLNTVSPRFFAEMFDRTTEQGRFLQADSSVFTLYTSDDPEIPRELVLDAEGRERFRKYLPRKLARKGQVFDRFVNWIENHPYPYVIGNTCWEFPCMVPSDWEAQHRHGVNNPETVADWKAALDVTVKKQGVFTMVFHPHGWIRSDQVVELIDHAVETHGKKVKFLTFPEAVVRLNEHLLDGNPLRGEDGAANPVRVLDVNGDGFQDVVLGGDGASRARLWQPDRREWKDVPFPARLERSRFFAAAGGRTGVVEFPSEESDRNTASAWAFEDGAWTRIADLSNGFSDDRLHTFRLDPRSVRFRDLDGDGTSEVIWIGAFHTRRAALASAVLKWSPDEKGWQRLPFDLPPVTRWLDRFSWDALRFVDVDEDGRLDVVYSDHERYGVWLFENLEKGWSVELLAGERGENGKENAKPIVLPPIVREDGSNNGFFVHSRHLLWQNEHTADLPDLVARVAFDDLLEGHRPAPKSPETSLKAIETRPGFTVELAAAEPLVVDPVAFEWGADGRLWVAEMADYPLGSEGGGRIRVLTDTDDDGRYDASTVFLDDLNFPSGVMPWRDGVLISAAPEVLFARDTDGDGRADAVETLLTGFGEGNQQHRVNGFVYGLDNRVHCANGDSDGRIRSTKTGEVTDVRGKDFSFDPDTGEVQLRTGRTQFGRNRDDWGHWFGCNNSNPMFHFVLAERYLRRNPRLAPPDPRVHVSETPGAAPCYPVSRPLPRFNDFEKQNRFTSANSAMVYRDELFGPAFAGNSFVSEPVHNLVHREVMRPDGVTFRSRRAEDERESEFLASRDAWFRPAMVKTGPDGALWVADMYRLVIEHPQYFRKELDGEWDVRAGDDRGRLYRVFPAGATPRPIPNLARLSASELVAALDSPSGWQRDTAQRLLVHRGGDEAAPHLERLFRTSRRPLARLHALCTLDGLDALTPELVAAGLEDAHPGVRRHAIRLAERFLSDEADLGPKLLDLLEDDDAHVRLQLAYTLGEWNDPRAGTALGELARRVHDDRYTFAAVLSSLNERNVKDVVAALFGGDADAPANPATGRVLAIAVRMGGDDVLADVLVSLTGEGNGENRSWRFDALAEVLDAHPRLLAGPPEGRLRAAVEGVRSVIGDARRAAADGEPRERVAAVSLLGREPSEVDDDLDRLRALLDPRASRAVQEAAIARLGEIEHERVPSLLLDPWRSYAPQRRSRVLDVLLARSSGIRALLDAVEADTVPARELDAARRQRLLGHPSDELRERARTLLAGAVDEDRARVLQAFRGVLTTDGDASRGKMLFTKHCATCHRLDGLGTAVGPDLRAVQDTSPEALLVAVLDPNRSVESKYTNYVAVTADGRSFNGVLAGEAGNAVTLLAAEGKRHTLLRDDLELLQSTGKSAMPEGLEKDLEPRDLADLFAFVRSSVPAPQRKRFPGNEPRVVTADEDGSLRLTPATASIYGPSLVLEKRYGNLGYWSDPQDHVVWELDVPAAGEYEVHVEFACHPSTAGNRVLFRTLDARLERRVPTTEDWDTYRTESFGRLPLADGRQRLVVRSAGPIRSALLDLKSVTLVPAE